MDIDLSAPDTFMELLSSGMLIVETLQSKKFWEQENQVSQNRHHFFAYKFLSYFSIQRVQ
jgi:hypothetical protein